VMREVGAAIGRMHDSDVVHGDLTTSNIMIRKTEQRQEQGQIQEQTQGQEQTQEQGADSSSSFSHADSFQVVLIDFGLGMTQPSIEDRAVDLYVLERAFLSTHPGSENLVSSVVIMLPVSLIVYMLLGFCSILFCSVLF
jgi:TP53 regulating kinase and related kinases